MNINCSYSAETFGSLPRLGSVIYQSGLPYPGTSSLLGFASLTKMRPVDANFEYPPTVKYHSGKCRTSINDIIIFYNKYTS